MKVAKTASSCPEFLRQLNLKMSCTDSIPPPGWLVHKSSKKPVHPKGGSSNPLNDTRLVMYSGGLGEFRLQFRFEPVNGQGHFGYIRHSSGKYVHPKGGSQNPGDDTNLVLYNGKHSACLMCFDEMNDRITQKGSNRIWYPRGGSSNPVNDASCTLHSDRQDTAKYFMADIRGNKISPYPCPDLFGKYVLIHAIINAQQDTTYNIAYDIGEERTETTTVNDAWNLSAEVAKDLFSARAEYRYYVSQSSSQTWLPKITTKHTIHVKKGETVATWQYDFVLSQYGDAYTYYSSIIVDTDDPYNPPNN